MIRKGIYILKVYSVYYTIHWDKSQILRQFPLEKIHGAKNATFFLSRAPTHHSWLLYGLRSTRFVSVKLCVGFSIFDSVPFLLKFIHLLNNMHERFDFKMSKLFLKLNYRKATHSFAPRRLIFNSCNRKF